jgi:hypothetical protein
MATSNYNQFSNARPLLSDLPAHVTGDDAERLGAYQLNEEIYWNVPDTFKLVQRGTEEDPIYIPSARMCVEALNRFYAVGFDYTVAGGTSADQESVGGVLRALFRRERFFSKFNSFKRFGLVRGDALWHIIADDTKPAGRRISLHELQPSQYFPIYDVDDVDRVLGCHIVQLVKDAKGDMVAKRQTYRRVLDSKGKPTGPISSELAIYKATAWDDRNIAQDPQPPKLELVQQLVNPFELPPSITALPVYHVKNQWQSGDLFGSSEVRGFERVISGLNQGISDQELALALEGLGVYWTTAKRPKGGWVMGPGTVVEGEEGEDFSRVNGIGSVTPSIEHLNWMQNALKQSSGTPDIAIGNVDVSVAESGISLALQMGPLLARGRERETELLAVHDNMLFDLTRMWLPAYEQIANGLNVTIDLTVGDGMPTDRAAVLGEVLQLLTAQIISPEYARFVVQEKLGYQFPDSMGEDIIANIEAVSSATSLDPYAERIRKELLTDEAQAALNGSGG